MATEFSPREQLSIFSDFRPASTALEHRNVSGSVITLSSSLSQRTAYFLAAVGNTVFVTFNGQTPSIADGTGSNLGIPIGAGEKYPFVPGTGETQVKAICASSDTARLVLYPAISGSLG